jgi:hypothetical protein
MWARPGSLLSSRAGLTCLMFTLTCAMCTLTFAFGRYLSWRGLKLTTPLLVLAWQQADASLSVAKISATIDRSRTLLCNTYLVVFINCSLSRSSVITVWLADPAEVL